MRPLKLILLVTTVTLLLNSSCKRNNPSMLNLDFEKIKSKTPVNWSINQVSVNKFSLDSVETYSGKYSIKIENAGNKNNSGNDISIYKLISNIKPESSIKLSGFIKTENTSVDSIGLYLGCGGFEGDTGKILRDKRLIGTNSWNEFSVELPVTGDLDYFYLGLGLTGEGKIWIDNLKFYVDNKQLLKMPPDTKFNASKKELNWLKDHSVPIKTVKAESGFEDLEPLKKFIGDARIVGLGENTHGTSEVFSMKHRLVEFLASEMGFTIFSIEANMPETYKVNDYILQDKFHYDAKSLLKGMYFWTWNTQEVLDMILWMKKFNTGSTGKLQFTGFDMQYYMGSMENLNNFAVQYDPHLKSKTDSLSVLFEKLKMQGKKAIEKKDELAFIKIKVMDINSYLRRNESKLSAKAIGYDYNWLLQNVTVLLQCLELNEKASTGFTYRDESMAKNIEWILDHNADSKIVLWAHNGHITKQPGRMGSYLSKKYGDKYYNIGFLSNTGTYTAVNTKMLSSDNILLKGKPGSFEYAFHRTKRPIFYFDFSRINENEPESKWLSSKLYNRNIGALATENQFSQSKLINQYNAIIYIDSTRASKCFNITR